MLENENWWCANVSIIYYNVIVTKNIKCETTGWG